VSAVQFTPLCRAGHLPLEWGDRLSAMSQLSIFPLEGEMAGRPEGGTAPHARPYQYGASAMCAANKVATMNHAPVPPTNRKHARTMRKDMTEPELKLWNELRAHRLMGLGFRRQLPIAGYIVDFACPSCKLIVELDGSQHGEDGSIVRDRLRDAMLQQLGWTVLRFWNDDVLRDVEGVCGHVVAAAGETTMGELQ